MCIRDSLSGMRNTVRLDNKYQALLYLVVHCYIYYLAVRESDDCVPALSLIHILDSAF